MSITAQDWQAATAAIRAARGVVISCHLHPDGDALGSALALHLALTAAGRPSVASFSEPFTIPPTYRFLPGLDTLTPPDQVPADADLFICFDTGSPDRLGTLQPALESARQSLIVDHHASNPGFGDLNLIDPAAPASTVLCRELLLRLGLPLDTDIATCLYTGLITDTGRFAYQATTADTHRLAAELLEAGVQPYEVAKAVFETSPIGYLRLLGDVLGRTQQAPDASLVWAAVTQDDVARHQVGLEDTEGLIDVVRTDAASDTAAVFKEQPDGTWKVSLRSKGRVDVGAVATALGGGGHRYAAGFTTTEGLDAAVKSVLDALTS